MYACTLALTALLACDQSPEERDTSTVAPTTVEVTAQITADSNWMGDFSRSQASLLTDLSDESQADGARAALVAMGHDALPALEASARNDASMVARGWAVKAISEIEASGADEALIRLHDDTALPGLVQAWAGAGRISRADTLDELLALAPLVGRFSALNRPMKMKLSTVEGGIGDVGGAIGMMVTDPSLQSILAPLVLEQPPDAIVEVMIKHENMEARRTAAGFLATMSRTDVTVLDATIRGYDFQPGAKAVPWAGGPLYIPSAQWGSDTARELIENLISWHLFCEVNKLPAEQQQINNNLRSVGFVGTAGYNAWDLPQDTDGLLVFWGTNEGSRALSRILGEHGLRGQTHYKKLLERVQGSR
ncbi:MAG: hypothetical protein ACI8RZ_004294 [Myxococcota bacterium]|jgi:hypothetical protein